ncbi:MAG: ribosome maturation factor RimP [Gammaproteobacteria bacterium]|nr:MAG: ribosome maturation factor RimP [Gammaproteobacteria bacterium]RLA56271.1 MAG: ribosome maturation factor RimP [Gammaproteobacteria bacterium]HDY82905.1 ribosome maturation factor RimP [Halieaceae bacterium]
MATKEQQIAGMLKTTIEAMGFDLWGVEYLSQGRHTLVRIYIDAERGIGVDDCAAVSVQVGGVFDVEDPISGEYTLEVSSPGMDRLLFKLEQYAGYVGEIVELRLRSTFEGRRKFKGILKGVEGDDVVIQVDDHEYLLPHSAIEKARVQTRVL